MNANPPNALNFFDPFNAYEIRNNGSENSFDIDAFLDSVLMNDKAIGLGTELVPSTLAQGLGLASEASQGNQGSNGRKQGSTKAPPLSSARQPLAPGISPSAPFVAAKVRPERAVAYPARLSVDPSRLQYTEGGPSAAAAGTGTGTGTGNDLPGPQKQQQGAPSAAPQPSYMQHQQQQQQQMSQGQAQQQAAYAQAYQQQQAVAAYVAASQGQYGSGWPPNAYYPYYQPSQQYGMPYQAPYQTMGGAPGVVSAAPAQAPPQQTAGHDGQEVAGADDDDARAVKRPRLIWTDALHRRFLASVDRCGGVERAQPKAIMKDMGVLGLTRENVASHLQKFRVRLKKGGGEDGEHGDDEFHDEFIQRPSPMANNVVEDAAEVHEREGEAVDHHEPNNGGGGGAFREGAHAAGHAANNAAGEG